MLAREMLFKYKHIYDLKGSEELFIEAMKESVDYHSKNNEFYNKLLKSNKFSSNDLNTINDIEKIPAIPVDFFKAHEIRSIDVNDVEVHATSSGTLGQKSQVFLSKSDIRLGTKMAFKAVKYHGFISLIPTNYLILGYEPKKGNNMGNVKVLTGMTKLAPVIKIVFALRNMGNNYKIDYFGIVNALEKFNKQPFPVRIFGFPSYLYMLLTVMKEMNIKPLKLSKKSIVFTGGGWKKFDNMKINPDELRGLVEEMLGIPQENCRDFFSAVEHSVAYPECKNHHMHVPIWSRVIIRDVKTLKIVGYDTPGFLSFISPLVSGMPLSSVIMGDMAILRKGDHCGCGITTPYFEIIGRARTGTSKSCSATANEFMRGE